MGSSIWRRSNIVWAELALAIILFGVIFSLPVHGASFSDTASYKYREAIEFIKTRGIASGYRDGTFRPNQVMNRAELLKMVIESNYSDLPSKDCFTDVKASEWYAKYVCKGKELDIVKGHPDGSFRPGDSANFIEALVVLERAYGIEPEKSQGVWYEGNVRKATALKIIPQEVTRYDMKVTRGFFAELVTRCIKVQENDLDQYLALSEGPRAPSNTRTVKVSSVSELRNAFQAAEPNMYIILSDGIYSLGGERLSTAKAGTASAPIVVRSEHENGSIISTDGAEEAFQIDHPYYVFENLHVKVKGAGSYHAYKLNGEGHDAIIRGGKMEIFKGAESGVKGSSFGYAPYPDNLLVENTEIFFNEPTDYSLAEGIDGVGVRGWVIRNNSIHGIKIANSNLVAWGIVLKGNSQDSVIEGNSLYDNDVGISIGGTTGSLWFRDGDTSYEHRHGVVKNNTIMNTRDVALYLENANDTDVYNNTIVNSFTSGGNSSIDVRYRNSTADIRNNILDKPILDREGGSHTANANIVLGNQYALNDFVSLSNGDLHLKKGTALYNAAVNKGEDLMNVLTDKLGITRLTNDIGAYEVADSTLPPPPPVPRPTSPPPAPTPPQSPGSGSLRLMRDDGHGLPGMYAGSFGAADFDADGKIDVVMTGNFERRFDSSDGQGGNDQVRMYKNISTNGGAVRFQLQQTIADYSGTRGSMLDIGDFNGDGRKDFAVEMRNGSDIASFMNNRDWSFTKRSLGFANNSTSLGMKASDIDKDGSDDLVFNSDGGVGAGLWYKFNKSTNAWDAKQINFSHRITYGGTIAAGDLNGDGYPEIAVGGNSNAPFGSHDCSSNLLYGQTHRNLGGASGFEAQAMSVVSAFGLKVPASKRTNISSCEGMDNAQMMIADLDGDSKADVIIAGSSTGQNGVPDKNGQQYDFTVLFNRDGTGKNFEIWENTGIQDDCGGTSNGGPGNLDYPSIAVGDITGDSRPDIFVQGHHRDYMVKWGANCTRNNGPADPYIFENIIFVNNGDRTFTPNYLGSYLPSFGTSENLPGVLNFLRGRPKYVGEGGEAIADFNNDGKVDILFSGAELPFHSNGVNAQDYNSAATLKTYVLRNMR